MIFWTESARATLLQRGDASRGSSTESARAALLQRGDTDEASAAPLCSKAALVDSSEDPLEASPLCSKVNLADLVEDPLEVSPFCSAGSSGVPRAPSPLPPSGLRAKEEEAVIRGAPAPSRDYAESAFLEAGGAGPVGGRPVANQ